MERRCPRRPRYRVTNSRYPVRMTESSKRTVSTSSTPSVDNARTRSPADRSLGCPTPSTSEGSGSKVTATQLAPRAWASSTQARTSVRCPRWTPSNAPTQTQTPRSRSKGAPASYEKARIGPSSLEPRTQGASAKTAAEASMEALSGFNGNRKGPSTAPPAIKGEPLRHPTES